MPGCPSAAGLTQYRSGERSRNEHRGRRRGGGLGPGGESLATELAGAGLEVVGIDRRLVGGECPYFGCVPTKMMIRGADLLAEGRRIPAMAGTQHRRRRTGRRSPGGSATRRPTTGTTRWPSTGSSTSGVTFVRGHGRLAGDRGVEVDGADLRSQPRRRAQHRHRAGRATHPGPERYAVLDEPRRRPAQGAARLADRIGGGAIGVELAQVFSRFGVDGHRASRSPTGSSHSRSRSRAS